MSDTSQQAIPQAGTDEATEGFFVDTEPARPRRAVQPQPPTQTSQPVQIVDGQPVQPSGRFFTEDDIEKAREQERSKLYDRLDTMESQLREERERVAQEQAARQAEAERLAADARANEEAEMETRQLLERREAEWNERFTRLQAEQEQTRAIYEQERRLAELERYRNDRVAQEAEWIIPELRDLITGNSLEEVEASIEEMKQRTAAIMESIAQYPQQQPQMYRMGASPTAPPIGPMEQMSPTQQLTPDDIARMSPDQYRQHREELLAAASRMQRNSNGF